MEDTTTYRQIVKEAIRAYAHPPSVGHIEVATIFDDESGNYQLVHLGWHELAPHQQKRVYAVILHLRLHDGKVWIERDGTADGVANLLVKAGIPHDRIVLAFHSPWKRQFTDFAVA